MLCCYRVLYQMFKHVGEIKIFLLIWSKKMMVAICVHFCFLIIFEVDWKLRWVLAPWLIKMAGLYGLLTFLVCH